ncbi:hypothetical protein [Butyribacter intestini]|jgi:hypothetical protein
MREGKGTFYVPNKADKAQKTLCLDKLSRQKETKKIKIAFRQIVQT